MIKIQVDPIKTVTVEEAQTNAIFVKKKGKLVGFVVKEIPKGWILRLGYDRGATGHHTSLKQLINENAHHGYEFYIEE